MGVAQGQLHLDAGAVLPVATVAGADGSAVQFDDGAAQVESDAGSLGGHSAGVFALVEALEEALGVLVLEADARVEQLYDGLSVALAEHEAYFSAVEGVLDGIGEQVGEHLFEVHAVDPHGQGLVGMVEHEADAALMGVVAVGGPCALNELHHVGLLAMELHLALVNLALVEYLAEQQQQALCVSVDDVPIALDLGAVVVGAQAVGYFLHLLQRVDNQGERRANVVGGVDEELHLGLLELALLAAIVVEQQLRNEQEGDERIAETGPPRLVPGRAHDDGQLAGLLREAAVEQRLHLKVIGSGLQLVEGNAVCAFGQVGPVGVSVDAVLKGGEVGLLEVEHGKLHEQHAVAIVNLEAAAAAVLALAVHHEVRQVNLPHLHGAILDLWRIEGGDAVVVAHEDASVGADDLSSYHVFVDVESVAIDEAVEGVRLGVEVQNAVGGAHPQVARLVGRNAVDGFSGHFGRRGIRGELARAAVVEVKTRLGADEHVAVGHFEERVALGASQLHVPAQGLEATVTGVHAPQSVDGANPQQSAAVVVECANPVVHKPSLLALFVAHAEALGRSGGRVVDVESLAVAAEEERSVAVVGKRGDAQSLGVQLQRGLFGVGVVVVERLFRAQPVAAVMVAIEHDGRVGRLESALNLAVGAKAVDARLLHHAEHVAILRHGDRRHAAAQGVVLQREAPRREGVLVVQQLEEPLFVAGHP